MQKHWSRHIVPVDLSVKEGLERLDKLSLDAALFVVDENESLVGALTDGDIRRGLINGLSTADELSLFMNTRPRFVKKDEYNIEQIIEFKAKNVQILPVVNSNGIIVNVINFRQQKSYLPVDTLIMAGGKGTRLRPLTESKPKPLLPVAGKPIVEYNLDRLRHFGIDDIWISVNYLGEQIEDYFGDGEGRGQYIKYVWEKEPLGTLGAVKLVDGFKHECILVTNSDILTTLDYEDFFLDFIEKDADMSVVTIPYSVNIPYAVLETANGQIHSFREKPTYTYLSNGGIYLLKRKILERIPENTFYNSTDLMEEIINSGGKLISYPNRQYWLDIGKPEDYKKAQSDIKHLNL